MICRRGEDVNELFAARNVQVHALSELTDSAMLVMYQEIKETAKSLPNTSVAVAAFTTAASYSINFIIIIDLDPSKPDPNF